MQTEGIVGISIIILLIAYVSCVGAKEAKKEGMSAAEAAQLKLPTLHQSSAYCPYKPLYNQQLPWLVKVGKEWFCYENQDGPDFTSLKALSVTASLTGCFCNTRYTIRLINTIAKVQFNNIIYISYILNYNISFVTFSSCVNCPAPPRIAP